MMGSKGRWEGRGARGEMRMLLDEDESSWYERLRHRLSETG